MNLPVPCETDSAQPYIADSLELIRCALIRDIEKNPTLSWYQKGKVLDELDRLIENDRQRRELTAFRQRQLEELEHRLTMAEKQSELYRKYADVLNKLRLLKAQTRQAIARHRKERILWKIEVIERLLQLKAKYKPVKKENEYMKELLKIKRQQKLSEAKEQAILNSITKRSVNRAAFIKMVNEKFPDMADELLDNYDQQLFQQGTRR